MNGGSIAARSLLYVPGDDADKLAKALHRGADALIVDLEDTVPPPRKQSARAQVLAWLAELRDPPVRHVYAALRTSAAPALAVAFAEALSTVAGDRPSAPAAGRVPPDAPGP